MQEYRLHSIWASDGIEWSIWILLSGKNPGTHWTGDWVDSSTGPDVLEKLKNLFSGVKQPGRGVNHPPSSSAGVKKK
jgi:hypothetical protein